MGQVTVDVSCGTQNDRYTLYIIKGTGTSLLGRDWMRHIRLDWKSSIASAVHSVTSPCYQPLLDKYAEVFKDIHTLKLIKAHLQVQSQAAPKFYKPRAAPFALKEALERELKCL